MTLLDRLRERRLLAIVRGTDAPNTVAAIEVLVEAGIDLVEVSLTSRDALDAIKMAATAFGRSVSLGAGTVMTRDQANGALDAGATFLVTPGLCAGGDEGVRLNVPVLMGAFTPTEVAAAIDRGATAVKLFPADLGGPAYLTALRAPFPDVPFLPVGGIDEGSADAFLRVGAVAVGVGSPLLGDAASGGDLAALAERAHSFRNAVTPAFGEPR